MTEATACVSSFVGPRCGHHQDVMGTGAVTGLEGEELGWKAGIWDGSRANQWAQCSVWTGLYLTQADLCCLLAPQKVNSSMKSCANTFRRDKGQLLWLSNRPAWLTGRSRTLARSCSTCGFTCWRRQCGQTPSEDVDVSMLMLALSPPSQKVRTGISAPAFLRAVCMFCWFCWFCWFVPGFSSFPQRHARQVTLTQECRQVCDS